jgi:hypothetical protein
LPHGNIPICSAVDTTLDRIAKHPPNGQFVRRNHLVECVFDEHHPFNGISGEDSSNTSSAVGTAPSMGASTSKESTLEK